MAPLPLCPASGLQRAFSAIYFYQGDALKIGAGVAVISAIVYIVYMLVLTNFLDPDFAVSIAENQKAAAEEAGEMSTQQIQQQ